MRYSQLLIPTAKEVPAEAEIPSHQLMIRAGYIRKVASGTYLYLLLGWRSLRKIMEIIRQEMDAAGAQEVSAPILQPHDLWRQTGRDVDYGPNLCVFEDRHGRRNALAPTAEEVITTVVAAEVSSYKQLPINLYQINEKFRDEFRPRFGVLRSREFIMKDAYSFDADLDGLDKSYQAMYDAYCRIFQRCGVKYVVVLAESGEIGGTGSQEFMVPTPIGEDVIVHTADDSYAANIEKAEVDPLPKAAPIASPPAMAEVHTPNVGSIEAVCNFLKTTPAEMIKTLILMKNDPDALAQFRHVLATSHKALEQVKEKGIPLLRDGDQYLSMIRKGELDDVEVERIAALYRRTGDFFMCLDKLRPAMAVVRGDHELNNGKLRKILGSGYDLAPLDVVEFLTNAAVGFAGPQPAKIDVFLYKRVIDHAVAAMAVGVTGANKSHYHMRNVVPGRDFPLAGASVVVADIRNAVEGDTYQGKALTFSRGIEVGHVFKLGTKYSTALGATFTDETGADKPCLMGCYGIGVNRILASAIELYHDENGIVLPAAIAPFEVIVLSLNNDKPEVVAEAKRIHDALAARGVDVLLDDRDARPGVKFKDADLIGIPVRIVVGERALKEGNVEIKRRTDAKASPIPAGQAVKRAIELLGE